MKTLFALVLMVVMSSSVLASSELRSPFRSKIRGVTIANADWVDAGASGSVIRGNAPTGRIDELKAFGVTHVLIFKNDRTGDVAQEIKKLAQVGYPAERIKHVPFQWKEFPDFETPCKQTIEALQFIQKSAFENKGRVFFHCTVGEDRTGYLAGLLRLMQNPKQNQVAEVFKKELCSHGYSSGDPRKPKEVSDAIDRDLTPLFLKMASLVKSGALSWENLNPGICSKEPTEAFDLSSFRCERQSI